MKTTKILFVVSEDWYFCSHRLPLAAWVKKNGQDVVVATRITNRIEDIEAYGIRVIPLRYFSRSSLNIFFELITFFEILKIFFKERPDLIHLVALKPVIYGSLAAKIVNIRARVSALGGLGFIFTSKGYLAFLLKRILLIIFRFIFNDKRSRLILQNQDDLRLLTDHAGVRPQYICLIRSAGVDLNQYAAFDFPEGNPIVMLASRMLWDKGVVQFVDAARELRKKNICARFVLVGDPDIENPSSISIKQLDEWHDSGIVEWWGYRSDMPSVLSQASIVCLPSFYGEGIPKVLIEAMACARPIITTNMPGCRDLVLDNRNGFLVNPRDSLDLMSKLEILLLNPVLCRSMGIEGRRIAEIEFSLPRIIDETMVVYKQLLNE